MHLGHGSEDKESAHDAGDLGSIPGLGRSPGERKGYPLQYFGLDNPVECIQSLGSQWVGHNWATFTFRGSLHFVLLLQNLWSGSVVLCSVVSNSWEPHRLYSSWDPPAQNTGVGSLSFLLGIFPTQGSNPGLPHCRQILYQLTHKESLYISQN